MTATNDTGDVKSARRVLKIFQLFAEARQPISLTLIARQIGMPKSSCSALLKTLESNGYLYRINASTDYYPTRRILDEAQAIVDNDPVLSHLRPVLKALGAATGETVFVARRMGHQSHYLEVVQSGQTLRYAASVGEKRALHIGAAGQCLLAAMDKPERDALIDQMEFEKYSPGTVTSKTKYRKLIEEGIARGWFMSVGGYQSGVASIGSYARINGEAYAIVVGAPTQRLTQNEARISKAVVETCRRIWQAPQ